MEEEREVFSVYEMRRTVHCKLDLGRCTVWALDLEIQVCDTRSELFNEWFNYMSIYI